jgi:hypothetical protein
MDKRDYTIVIQGKIHERTIEMCNFHRDMETIVSTWDSDIPHEQFLQKALRPNLTIVSNPLPDTENINNVGNRYYQFMSSLHGMRAVKTKFAIKVRSDEYYSNLDPIIATSISSPEKMITNDVFFRKTKFYQYHPSDHLMAAKTEYMISLFEECCIMCKNNYFCVSEQIIGMTYIAQQESRASNQKYSYLDLPAINRPENFLAINQLMVKHFDIVSSFELGNFYVTANFLKNFWNDCTYYIADPTDVRNSHSLAQEL